jgi:large subunit ribosomal protein L32e
MKELLKYKQVKKKKTPEFIRQDIHKKKRLAVKWRRPRGIDSKKRLMKNNRYKVKPGYGTPTELKGLNKDGKVMVAVSSLNDVKNYDPKNVVLIISGKLGMRSKMSLIQELLKLSYVIENIKDPKKYVDDFKNSMESKKKKVQDKKKTEKNSVDKKEESIEDKISDEDKKKVEKKEIDKLLTKKF